MQSLVVYFIHKVYKSNHSHSRASEAARVVLIFFLLFTYVSIFRYSWSEWNS